VFPQSIAIRAPQAEARLAAIKLRIIILEMANGESPESMKA